MSLSNEHKMAIERAISRIQRSIRDLEDTPADFRALDLLEVVCALFEQQIEQDIEFIDDSEDLEGAEDYTDFVAQQAYEEKSWQSASSYEDDSPTPSETPFKFFNNTEDAPSAEELGDWFKLNIEE